MDQTASVGIGPGNNIRVNGLHMYYESHGSGSPVILLHGGLKSCQMWTPTMSVLSKYYQVITPDSRAHGRTDNPSGSFNYQRMAEDIAQFIQTLGLQKPVVGGYSDGGQTALEMAMAYPGLAGGYLIGAVSNAMTPEWRGFMQGFLGFEGPGRVDFEQIAQTNPALIQSLQEKHDVFHTPGYWKTLLAQVSQCWWDPPVHPQADFARIIDPVLFWCGDRDVFCPPEQSLEMYRMLMGAELAVIPFADHFSMLQQIDIANEVLLNFINRVNGLVQGES